MAITYGFYNSLNGDRKYDAVQLSSIFDGVIRDGVFQSIGGYLATKPGEGMQVIVSPGKAWFDHTWTVNDADLPLEISQSDLTLSRYDAVVLETDATKAVRENSIKVIKGTPASDPKKPTLTNEGDVHQHPLAYILVPGGSTEIQVQSIDIMVGKTECPFVTSILESVSIEALLEKWEGEFRVWFDELQNQMAGDVATNLQNQITRNAPSVGDIVVSYFTGNRGPQWLLANGSEYDTNKYPELFSHLSKSMDMSKEIPKLPICTSAIYINEMAFYQKGTSNEDSQVFYSSKKLGSPDFSHPIDYRTFFSSSQWHPPLYDVSFGYANGFYFIFEVRLYKVFILYSTNGVEWKEHVIQPSSSITVEGEKLRAMSGIYYMDGNYYLLCENAGDCGYIKVKDIFSYYEYAKEDFNWTGEAWNNGTMISYINKNSSAIYFARTAYGTSSMKEIKPTGMTNYSLSGYGGSCEQMYIYENGGTVECITQHPGSYFRSTKNGYSQLSKNTNDYTCAGVFQNENGEAYFVYKSKVYKLNKEDYNFTEFDSIALTFGTALSHAIGINYVKNCNSTRLIGDTEKQLFCGCSFYELAYAGSNSVRYHGVHSNSPHITPCVASENGIVYVRGEK